MTQESIQRLDYKPETPLLGSHVKLIKRRPEIVTRATEALHEAGMLGLLVILAVGESVKKRRASLPDASLPDDIEQLREYGDWVD